MFTGVYAALIANVVIKAVNTINIIINIISITNIIITAIITAVIIINIKVIIFRRINITRPIAAAAAANTPLPPPISRYRLRALQTEALVISYRLAYERYIRRLIAYLFIKP